MAKARFYSLNNNANNDAKAKKYIAELKGQARIVFDELKNDTTPRLASEILEKCGEKIRTRQDVLRVVLYYIIVFKGKGFVSSFDTRPAENGEVVDDFQGVTENA